MERQTSRSRVGLFSVLTPLAALDLKSFAVVAPQKLTPQEKTALAVLTEEIQKRSQMRLSVQTAMTRGARRRSSWGHPPNSPESRERPWAG